MRRLKIVAWLAWMLAGAAPAVAQQGKTAHYPAKAVRFVLSGPPGGGVDTVARILADRLQARFGQPFIVENRPGAGGNLGAEIVAKADPDGYTLLAAQPAALTTNIVLYKKLNFDPEAFEPLAIMTSIPNVAAVRNGLAVSTLQELVAHANANPGALNYGSQGVGTTPHLTTELFTRVTGARFTHVPHRGTVSAVNDLVAGHLDILMIQLDAVRELHLAGKLTVLATFTEQRVASLTNVPTAAEAGIPGLISNTWNALVAPPNTSARIVTTLNMAINEELRHPQVLARLRELSMEPIGGTPSEVRAYIRSETERWGGVIRAAGILLK